jgi:hypothetical protein
VDNAFRSLITRAEAFLWSDDTEDADGATVAFSKSVYDQIAPTYPQPHIVLNHETVPTTPSQTIPYAVQLLKSKGYQLVAVVSVAAERIVRRLFSRLTLCGRTPALAAMASGRTRTSARPSSATTHGCARRSSTTEHALPVRARAGA